MKKIKLILAASVAAMSLAVTGATLAQTTMEPNKMGMDKGTMPMAGAPGMTEGEIRKIDKETGKITIKHGEIKHMEMPPMTMVFHAKDKAMLDKVQVGQKIQFVVIQEPGKMVVTEIQPAK